MLHCFDPIRDMTFWAILARLTLAVVCGGLIGAEREIKRRPAGFRTHILICLGSAITTLTSQYLLFQHLYNDIARLGAQVISGIGFVGAGTIIVTRDKRVKGLTTAAGLWAAAIIGLVCGAGYAECAIFATAVVLLVEVVFLRKWCGKFCPLGALISLVSGANRTLRPHVNNATCLFSSKGTKCFACSKACPEHIDVRRPELSEAAAANCTKCRECADACPAHAITFPVLAKGDEVNEDKDK